ncbi:MAG: ExbD/TolR family protein [Stenotrophobium sp.]
MKSSHRIRRMQRHNRMRSRAVHLNIVSLIDVFAVLVFFLLLSASLAADRISALGLDLPAPSTHNEQQPQKQLTVVIHRDGLVLTDRQGRNTSIPNIAEGHDVKTLAARLAEIKQTAPGEEQIVLLLDPDVAYNVLVQVMDASRSLPAGIQIGDSRSRDMFPLISIGDADQSAAAPAAGGKS